MKARFGLAGLFQAALASTLLLAGPAVAQNCVSFQGIDHCPVGDASLSLTADGLAVQNHGGNSGVSARFAPTVLWEGRMQFPQGEHSMDMASISGGETTSRLLIEPNGDSYSLRAVFTGASEQPTYSVLVYNDGILQGAIGGLDGSAPTKAAPTKRAPNVSNNLIDIEPVDLLPDWWWWWPWFWGHFSIAPAGGCNWGLGLAADVAVNLPDGQRLIGDEIRFTEDVAEAGHYPYLGFESIETRSTASGFLVTDELAEGTN